MSIDLTQFQILSISFTFVGVLISLFALRTSMKSVQINELGVKRIQHDRLNSLHAVEVNGFIQVDGQTRALLTLFNLRKEPIKIECVKVYIHRPIDQTLRNKIKHYFQPFDWNYMQVNGLVWNPKGDLDDREHSEQEALHFSYVKEVEKILVTIPNFDESNRYLFRIFSNIGYCDRKTTVTNNRRYFATDYHKQMPDI